MCDRWVDGVNGRWMGAGKDKWLGGLMGGENKDLGDWSAKMAPPISSILFIDSWDVDYCEI